MYESEITRFMRDFVKKNPQVVEQQKKNRSPGGTSPQDLETLKEHAPVGRSAAGLRLLPAAASCPG